MFDEDDQPLKHKQPQTFPRKLEGLSVATMKDYITDLEAEIVKVKEEIDARGGMKSAAESLFKK